MKTTKPKPLIIRAPYFAKAFDKPSVLARLLRSNAFAHPLEFDTIVGTGLSGAIVVPSLARALRKHFAIVRKVDGSHSSNKVEGTIGARWLFVDDFICTGDTKRRCQEVIANLCKDERHSTQYVGTWEYEYDRLTLPR